MKREWIMVVTAAAVMTMPVWAAVPLLEKEKDANSGGNYRIGAPRWFGNPTAMGRMLPSLEGRVFGSGYGFAFDGPTEVSSFAYQAAWVDGYLRGVSGFDVYANGKFLGKIALDNTDVLQPNVPIWAVDKNGALVLDRNGEPMPITITANWLTLVPTGMYGVVNSNTESGVTQFYFNGTPCTGPFEVNRNLSTANGGSRVSTSSTPLDLGSVAAALDGQLFSDTTGRGSLWKNNNLNSTPDSLTVTYDQPMDVLSVGIALLVDDNNRRIPKEVYVSGFTRDGDWVTQPISLDHPLTYYNRYDLETALFTSSLEIAFPAASDSSKWWSDAQGWYGLAEFQAFGHVTPGASYAFIGVPEPMTMSLLMLGGVALLRRRSRRYVA